MYTHAYSFPIRAFIGVLLFPRQTVDFFHLDNTRSV